MVMPNIINGLIFGNFLNSANDKELLWNLSYENISFWLFQIT